MPRRPNFPVPGLRSAFQSSEQRVANSKHAVMGHTQSVHMPVHSVNGHIFFYRFIVAIFAIINAMLP